MKRGGGERRYAGVFRVCPACGKRNFIGRTACTQCNQDLAHVPSSGSPPASHGQRAADTVFGRRGFWYAGAALAVILGTGLLVRSQLRSGLSLGPSPPPSTTASSPSAPPATEPERQPSFASHADQLAFERGRALLAAGRAREALRPLSRAAAASPRDSMVVHLYGLALFRSGARERGLFELEHAVLMAPGVVSYRLELVRALTAAGRHAAARRHYEAALALDPASVAAQHELLPSPSPAPGAASVDLGGAGRAAPASSAPGTSFTDEDLGRQRPFVPATTPRRPLPALTPMPSASPTPSATPSPASPAYPELSPPVPDPSPGSR